MPGTSACAGTVVVTPAVCPYVSWGSAPETPGMVTCQTTFPKESNTVTSYESSLESSFQEKVGVAVETCSGPFAPGAMTSRDPVTLRLGAVPPGGPAWAGRG